MECNDWDTVLQFTSESMDQNLVVDDPDKGLTRVEIPPITPSASQSSSPSLDDQSDMVISVSSTFFAGLHVRSRPPDLVFLSIDFVFFYVHSPVLLEASENGFRSHAYPPVNGPPKDEKLVVAVDETAEVLNVILHSVYNMSCAHYHPTFDTLVTAVQRFPLYGLQPKPHIAPSMPLTILLLSFAPLFPLDLYTLAAQFDLYDLAVSTSPHLLSIDLSTVTDEMAERIGPVYLKRLFFLHFERTHALKRALIPPPLPHPPTASCDFTSQKALTRAWALASAYLAWDATPDLPISRLDAALRPVSQQITCELCKETLNDRMKSTIVQWTTAKRTIE